MGLIQEFKKFAVKGNMVDIAIGVIIGAAFQKVIDVLVKQVMMPPLTLLTDGVNFEDKQIVLREAYTQADGTNVEVVSIGYGELISVFIDFFIIALVVFIVMKLMNALKAKSEDENNPTVETPKEIQLMARMNELLEEQNRMLKEKTIRRE
ncbi:large conductance mechanosensitive channel protein MscL [Leeuwenhoekiella parthenopeia]|uniref:Large-conductance mechanosensitive channel n=1 Tax=Leeuwenhoekiella parthenopeia TaxID=2890320 RepID=A0ABS8GSM5_9FLAO|nr:large conductance mechanosensitive channel protein MscL [Leeuwenhoekiella parthenopeia]MCC4212665.1 large conductance mechanosensitive channel protein MscL [Leeuwenhoekiella parthenopeia]